MNKIETDRLILRQWQDEDIAPFAAINQDSKVIEFLRGPLSLEQARDWINNAKQHFIKHQFGLWATTLKTTGELIGFMGLDVTPFTAHFTPCVEIGWRLGSQYWGKGYATEAANVVCDLAFTKYGLKEIVSFTVPANIRSIKVMEKIGMRRDLSGDFHHPKLAHDHPLSLHVLYRKLSHEK